MISEQLRQIIQELPEKPGCYLMKGDDQKIFYIGKAINLRARVKSYFTGGDHRLFVSMLDKILKDLDIIVVPNETEALLLERNLIQHHQPKYNVLLKDDKNFLHLKLLHVKKGDTTTKSKKYPRLEIVRKASKDGALYFGPYHSANALRQSLQFINRHFLLRPCSDRTLENRNRPCLQYQIHRCAAPCVFEVDDYSLWIQDVKSYLKGQGDNLVEDVLIPRMKTSAKNEDFEQAALYRDQIKALQSIAQPQLMVRNAEHRDQDFYAFVRKNQYIEISRLVIRSGQVLDKHSFSYNVKNFPSEELFSSFLSQFYAQLEASQLPDQIVLNLPINQDFNFLAEFLSSKKGKKIKIINVKRGDLLQLMKITIENAQTKVEERIRSYKNRQDSLESLMKKLHLQRLPKKIECFDISLIQGSEPVASKVCFIDGKASKKYYRHYQIRNSNGQNNDFEMMYEVISRRLNKTADDPLPDLLLVDGGKGQLNIALQVLKELKQQCDTSKMMVAAIAKSRVLVDGEQNIAEQNPIIKSEQERSYERIFIPNAKEAILLKHYTAERYLVESIRDEAHRFAITYHRQKRRQRTLKSELSEIPGIGLKTQKLLLNHFKSLKNIKKASVSLLMQAKGIGPETAQKIHNFFST